MVRCASAMLTAVFAAGGGLQTSAVAASAAPYQHFKWEKINDNVWFGISPPASFISGNTVIIKIPGGAFVVDPHITASTAREIIAKAREVAGPVKYLVNTHLHNDHSQGNGTFKEAFPNIEIIAHKNSCWGEKEKAIPRSQFRLKNLPAQMVTMRDNLAKVSDPKLKADLERVIAGNDLYLEDAKTLQWALPNECLNLEPGQAKVYTFGNETVEVRYYGRAHTAGDVVVYLPRQKLIAVGDLWGAGGGFDFGRDGSGLEYPITLRGISRLDFDTVLPGHGEVVHGKASLEAAIETIDKLIGAVKASHARGEYLDMTIENIPSPRPLAGLPAGASLSSLVPYMSAPAAGGWRRNITRAYEEIEILKQHGMPIPQ